jgi:mannose-1-phosphate guanylyltransferase
MFTGVHVLSPAAFDALPEEGCIVRKSHRRWVDEGHVVAGVVDESPWRDLGTLAEYLAANLDLARGALSWPGITPGPNGSLIHPAAVIEPGAVVTESVVGEGARIAGGVRVHRSVVWDGAAVTGDVDGVCVARERIVGIL